MMWIIKEILQTTENMATVYLTFVTIVGLMVDLEP